MDSSSGTMLLTPKGQTLVGPQFFTVQCERPFYLSQFEHAHRQVFHSLDLSRDHNKCTEVQACLQKTSSSNESFRAQFAINSKIDSIKSSCIGFRKKKTLAFGLSVHFSKRIILIGLITYQIQVCFL